MINVEVNTWLELLGKIGLALALTGALYYAVFIQRRTKDGESKSSLLVPGWIHDEAIRETSRVRAFYEKALSDEQERGTARASEWRALRDEEAARRADAEEDSKSLLAAVNALAQDVRLLLEIQKLANRNSSQSTATGTGSSD